MADEPAKAQENPLQEEEREYVEEARRHKAMWELDLRELYFFAAPHRARQITSRVPHGVKPQDAGEANTSFACEMSQDFATNILTTFCPEMNPWVARKPGLTVPDSVKSTIAGQIKTEDAKVFEGIAASNFYTECQSTLNPDLAAGTIAMWIDDPLSYKGIQCQAIPIHELEICVGPDGKVDFRSFVQHSQICKLPELLPRVKKWPLHIETDMKSPERDKRRKKVEVRRSFWRDWSVTHDVVWQHVVVVDREVVHSARLKGEGSSPMIVARWNPAKEWAFGFGAGLQALPDYRHLDELAAAKILNCDMSLRPPITIPDDSLVNFENGVEAGFAYPIRNGSEDAVKEIYNAKSPDVAIYDRNDVEQRIKRLHFLDYPDQMGKTPPSATQWLDQMTMAQRRIGTPGQAFWREWCAEVFLRFAYLLGKRGYVKPVKYDGKQVSLEPENPARQAADQQKIAQAARIIQIAGEAWPEEWKASVDGASSIKNMIELGGATDVLVMRTDDQKAAAISMIAKLQQGQTPGAPAAAANAGQPGPPPQMGPPPAPMPMTQIRGSM